MHWRPFAVDLNSYDVRNERIFEQEAMEHTERGSVLSFLGYLLFDFEATLFRADDEESFRVFCVFRGLNFRAP